MMKCPECDSDIPGRDLVCGDCGAYVYRNVPAVPREKSAETPPANPSRSSSLASLLRPDMSRRRAESVERPATPHTREQSESTPIPSRFDAHQSGVDTSSGYSSGTGGPDYVYPTLHGWPGLAPRATESNFGESPAGLSRDPGGLSLNADVAPDERMGAAAFAALGAEEARRRGRAIGRWSIGLAMVALLLPVAGLIGVATGVMAWRLGETKLGRIGVILSTVASLIGVAFAVVLSPTP